MAAGGMSKHGYSLFCLILVPVLFSIGLFVATISYFQTELHSIQSELLSKVKSEHDEIETLRLEIRNEINTTTALNSTITQSQDNIQQQIVTVNEDMSTQTSLMAYQFAGTFTILTVMVFVWHMTSHLRNFNEPFVQRKILAILWMCPIYGITSWLSLVFVSMEGFLAIVKDVYEAYCIYTFLSFLIAVLGRGDREVVVDLLSGHADHLRPPMKCFGFLNHDHNQHHHHDHYETDARAKADAILHQCQLFAMQFVLLRPLTTLAMVVSEHLFPGGSVWNYKSPQLYITIITNISICFAFSGLMTFYHAVQEDLAWCRPFPKFLCIKGVVFMTFWQKMAITILAETLWRDNIEDNDTDNDGNDSEDGELIKWTAQAQNFLICLEMLFFSIAHCFTFPTEEWEEGYRSMRKNALRKFGDNIALRDFLQDVKLVMKKKKKQKSSSKRLKGKGNADQATTLQSDLLLVEELDVQDDLSPSLRQNLSDDASCSSFASEEEENEEQNDGDCDVIWQRIEKVIEQSDQDADDHPEIV